MLLSQLGGVACFGAAPVATAAFEDIAALANFGFLVSAAAEVVLDVAAS